MSDERRTRRDEERRVVGSACINRRGIIIIIILPSYRITNDLDRVVFGAPQRPWQARREKKNSAAGARFILGRAPFGLRHKSVKK